MPTSDIICGDPGRHVIMGKRFCNICVRSGIRTGVFNDVKNIWECFLLTNRVNIDRLLLTLIQPGQALSNTRQRLKFTTTTTSCFIWDLSGGYIDEKGTASTGPMGYDPKEYLTVMAHSIEHQLSVQRRKVAIKRYTRGGLGRLPV